LELETKFQETLYEILKNITLLKNFLKKQFKNDIFMIKKVLLSEVRYYCVPGH